MTLTFDCTRAEFAASCQRLRGREGAGHTEEPLPPRRFPTLAEREADLFGPEPPESWLGRWLERRGG